jgi:hypothetical protein
VPQGCLLGVWHAEQAGLGGGGGAMGTVGLGTLAGEAVAILGGFLKEVECLGRESEFVLGDRQAAAAALHGGWLLSGGFGVGWKVSLVLVAGVAAAAGGEMAARVLPCLALPIPMETKL